MKNLYFNLIQFFITCFRFFYTFLNDGTECIICSKKTFFLPICKECINSHYSVQKVFSVPRCSKCGKELISTEEDCIKCRENPILIHADKVICLFSYRLWNKELLFLWKIKGERSLSHFFSKLIHDALVLSDINVVVPVPPRKGKIKKNGWDQIDELCNFLEKRFDVQILKILERNSVQQQKKLNREERLDTIKNAYSLINHQKMNKVLKKNKGILPEKVCLIDDVCTTGATLECCAKILKDAGVQTVCVMTLFIVD